MERPTVFICRDHMMDPLLGAISDGLEAKGVGVLRGPENAPGEIIRYTKAQRRALIDPAQVAMFSSRSVCDAPLLAAAQRLCAVVTPSIGVETVDVAAASEHGILVVNGSTPDNYIGMAEASIMLMLNLMLGLRSSEAVMRAERPRPAPAERFARTLHGKTVGLVGWGNISRAIAARLAPFGVEILVHSERGAAAGVPSDLRLVDLDTLLAESDIVGLYVAINKRTFRLIDERALGRMKPSAYLVNVARGDAVDEAALARALAEGRIAGAALDTFSVEPLPADSPLRALPNVILTPHMVGQTRESYAAACVLGVRNILDVLEGRCPDNARNPEIAARWQARRARLAAVEVR